MSRNSVANQRPRFKTPCLTSANETPAGASTSTWPSGETWIARTFRVRAKYHQVSNSLIAVLQSLFDHSLFRRLISTRTIWRANSMISFAFSMPTSLNSRGKSDLRMLDSMSLVFSECSAID